MDPFCRKSQRFRLPEILKPGKLDAIHIQDTAISGSLDLDETVSEGFQAS